MTVALAAACLGAATFGVEALVVCVLVRGWRSLCDALLEHLENESVVGIVERARL